MHTTFPDLLRDRQELYRNLHAKGMIFCLVDLRLAMTLLDYAERAGDDDERQNLLGKVLCARNAVAGLFLRLESADDGFDAVAALLRTVDTRLAAMTSPTEDVSQAGPEGDRSASLSGVSETDTDSLSKGMLKSRPSNVLSFAAGAARRAAMRTGEP